MSDETAMRGRFSLLRLEATHLGEMQRFYASTLGLSVKRESANSFAVCFGDTTVEFTECTGEREPIYHFALDISENKFRAAKSWLATRCPLLRDSESGADELFFEFWNAHAVYFEDPAGNIGELIARHTVPSARPGGFDVDDILFVSEIGLPSGDPDTLTRTIGECFGLQPYTSEFFLGDERGMFVLPRVGRPWIPERRLNAAVFPIDVVMTGHGESEWRHDVLPYVIRSEG